MLLTLDEIVKADENKRIVQRLEPGQQVDQFCIIRKLGQGGMSEVYLARDTTLGRKVALKIIRADFVDSPQRLKLFLHEARLTAKFSHPHIIAIHSVGMLEGHPYLALEYLEGQRLAQRMREGAMSVRETMRIGFAIAQALDEAHSHGVLYRDLKPANVMIPQDGRLRVLDFGISKIIEDDVHPPATAKEYIEERDVSELGDRIRAAFSDVSTEAVTELLNLLELANTLLPHTGVPVLEMLLIHVSKITSVFLGEVDGKVGLS